VRLVTEKISAEQIADAMAKNANDPLRGLTEPCELCETKPSEMDFVFGIAGGPIRAYLCWACFQKDWPDDCAIAEAVIAKRAAMARKEETLAEGESR